MNHREYEEEQMWLEKHPLSFRGKQEHDKRFHYIPSGKKCIDCGRDLSWTEEQLHADLCTRCAWC